MEKKADAKYAPCSAASVGESRKLHDATTSMCIFIMCNKNIFLANVVAKESRDTIIQNWKWSETPNYEPQNSNAFGSGYPSDPKCKSWLDSNCNVDVPFGFPDFVRFSWGPAKNALKESGEKSGLLVKWEADEEEEDDSGGKQSSMDSFIVSRKAEVKGRKGGNLEELKRKRPRSGIFSELGLSKVTKFVQAAY